MSVCPLSVLLLDVVEMATVSDASEKLCCGNTTSVGQHLEDAQVHGCLVILLHLGRVKVTSMSDDVDTAGWCHQQFIRPRINSLLLDELFGDDEWDVVVQDFVHVFASLGRSDSLVSCDDGRYVARFDDKFYQTKDTDREGWVLSCILRRLRPCRYPR